MPERSYEILQKKNIKYLWLKDNLVHISPLYADGDILDQLLCTKKKNIDLIIIKY